MISIWIFIFIVVLFLGYKVIPTLLEPLLTPLRRIPGPPSRSWFWGNLREYSDSDVGTKSRMWIAEYGHVIRFKLLLNLDRLLTTDTKAINHVLTHSVDYQKPDHTRAFVSRLFGEGILFAEGEAHRKQRRVMNPAFGPTQIRGFTELFFEKSIQLRDIWATTLNSSESDGQARIDVLAGLSRMTLDVIGLAGFGYEFNALNPTGQINPLGQALNEILSSGAPNSFVSALQSFIPFLLRIPTKRGKRINAALDVMKQIGSDLVEKKKAAILASQEEEKLDLSKDDTENRDLLTLLMRANMGTDIPENQRLSDADVIAQIPTFFIAGHETTASAVTWCLHSLSLDKVIQQKLREELLQIPTDTPSMDELMALPYLDSVLRETLRVNSPVTGTIRQAMKDDFIPLNKPYTDIYGKLHDSIQVRAGDRIMIPIYILNRQEEIWGEDAEEFRPERWGNPPEAASTVPGVWGNLLSFLGGPRSCIGYRFSLVEFKAIIFTLVRAFEFELAVPPEEILKKSSIVMRPIVKSEREKGNQMPMLVRPYRG